MRQAMHFSTAAAFRCAWLVLALCSVARAVSFDLDYDSAPYEAPSWDSGGHKLTDHFEAAAALWGDIIEDSHDIRIQYQWEELDDAAAVTIWHISEKHYFDTNGNGVNDSSVERIVNCTIKVDPYQSWWVDPTPWDHSEFDDPAPVLYRDHVDANPLEPAYAGSPPALLEVSCDMAPTSHTGRDLFTTIVHEFGHALGFNEASIDVDAPYRLVPEMVWGADVSVHDERHEGDQNRGHIDVPLALMSYDRVSQNRTLPSATDVLAMADFCRWTRIDLPRKDFMHVAGAEAYWDHRLNWTGAQVPDADDVVHIRSGDDVIVHWDAEAKSVTVDEGSSLTITGNQVLRVEELDIQPEGLLRLQWSGSHVELIDPATGAASTTPRLHMAGSLEMTQQARQSLDILTIRDETPGDALLSGLTMNEDAVLTLANELNLLGGVAAELSDADILVTSHTRAEVNLNGRMTLEDGSNVSTRTLRLMTDGGVDPRLSVLTGSRFSAGDDGGHVSTYVPEDALIEVDNTGSEFFLAHDLEVRGSVFLEHGNIHVRNMEVVSGGALRIDYGGELLVRGDGVTDGELDLRRGSFVHFQHNGSRIEADDLFLSTSMHVVGAAQIQTGYLRLNAWTGDQSAITLTLDGAGNVLQTDRLRIKSSPAHSASIVHNSGIVTVADDLEVESAAAASRYELRGGRLTVGNVLRVRDGGRLEFELHDGTFEVGGLDLQGAAVLRLDLDGGLLDVGALPVPGTSQFTLNLNGGAFSCGGAGALTLDRVNVAGRSSSDVDHVFSAREMTLRSLTVGQAGRGRLTLQAPATVAGAVVIGEAPGARGELVFSPADVWSVLQAREMHVGPAGHGLVVQTNGYVEIEDTYALQVGRGEYRLEGGWLETQTTHVGTTPGQAASVLVCGGRHVVSDLLIGQRGTQATYQVDSGRLDAGRLVVGDLRRGRLVQAGGTVDVSGDLLIGCSSGFQASVHKNDGFMIVSGALEIGAFEGTDGAFTHAGGSLSIHGDLGLGQGNGSIGRFDASASLGVDGDLRIGVGRGSRAVFRLEGAPGAYPTLEVGQSVHLAQGPESRGDFYMIGQGSQGPTLWLRDGVVDVGSGGVASLHMGGGRIRAVRNLDGVYDSFVKVQPGSSLRGYGQIDIPLINTGLVVNGTSVALQLMEKVSGGGVYQTEAYPANFQAGRIEFWNGGEVTGAIVSDGRVSAFSSANSLAVSGPIRGTGVFEAGGAVETSGAVEIRQLRVTGTLRQVGGESRPGVLELHLGTYRMESGLLETASARMGGTLEQTGGEIRMLDRLTIGMDGGFTSGPGTLRLAGGSIHVGGDLQIGVEADLGMPSSGELIVAEKEHEITVEGDLILTSFGLIDAVEGAEIRLLGSHVRNTSRDASAMGGLANLTLTYAPDAEVVDTFEVASDPLGGFADNFALGHLQLGEHTQLRLVDVFDNAGQGQSEPEVLLLGQLTIAEGAWLDLAGLDLRVAGRMTEIAGWIEDGRIFNGSEGLVQVSYDSLGGYTAVASEPVPEPAGLALLALGSLVGCTYRRKR